MEADIDTLILNEDGSINTEEMKKKSDELKKQLAEKFGFDPNTSEMQ